MLKKRIERVIAHGRFILGPEVAELEAQLKNLSEESETITCANGTDALALLLRAENIGIGDAVFVPAFTFAATAAAVKICGATPFFVDILNDFTIDTLSLQQAISEARTQGLKPKAVLPVDLYGLPAEYDDILACAKQENIFVFIDAAQSFGALYKGQKTIAIGDGAITSFFPTKPLGAYGDGGAVFTQNTTRAEKVRMLANHGQVSGQRYNHKIVGTNSRLDTIQAAVLLAKLTIFDDEIKARQKVSEEYETLMQQAGLLAPDEQGGKADVIIAPSVPQGRSCVWGQYTIRSKKRDKIMNACTEGNIACIIHYPMPLCAQAAYRDCPIVSSGIPRSEKAACEVLSIPMHPYIKSDAQKAVVNAISNGSSGVEEIAQSVEKATA